MKTTTNISYAAFALFALACFALSPQARAVCQEGCGSDPNGQHCNPAPAIRPQYGCGGDPNGQHCGTGALPAGRSTRAGYGVRPFMIGPPRRVAVEWWVRIQNLQGSESELKRLLSPP